MEATEVQSQQHSQPRQSAFHVWKFKLRIFISECKRVLLVTKKPDKEEFLTIVKVSGIGMLVIGFIGFVIQVMKFLILG